VGRPRSERARRAILAATLELSAESGPERLTMEAIARRAAVSKETLYRWWRSKSEIVLEALVQQGEETIPVPDTGSLTSDLRVFLRATATSLDPPTRRLLRNLASASAADETFANTVREQFIAHRRQALETVLSRGVERSELTAAQAKTATDLIFGSLWYRLIFAVGSLDRRWAKDVSELLGATSGQASSWGSQMGGAGTGACRHSRRRPR
jgi:AcrR family transcriptional regulator